MSDLVKGDELVIEVRLSVEHDNPDALTVEGIAGDVQTAVEGQGHKVLSIRAAKDLGITAYASRT